MRRAMKRGSSPASSIRASQYDRGVGVAAAHRLDERAGDVVVLVAGAVVDERLGLDRLLGAREVDHGPAPAAGPARSV